VIRYQYAVVFSAPAARQEFCEILVTNSWALSSAGAVRKDNEDSLLSRPDLGLWVVADGAGGHQSGAMASSLIVKRLDQLKGDFPISTMVELVREVLRSVHAQLRTNAQARGSEVVIASTFVALILRDDQFICLWAGDSRAYLLRQGELRQITKDHSLVQELVDLGKLAAADADRHPHANVITRAVGADASGLELDQAGGMIALGDRFLLCSDGLSKTLDPDEMMGLLSSTDATPPSQRLIDAALARHARDNVTAIVIDIPRA
jgi:serine/threonine-protein phosphatase Stp1